MVKKTNLASIKKPLINNNKNTPVQLPTLPPPKKPKKITKEKKEKLNTKDFPSLNLKTEREIAMDFAEKVYEKFDVIIKSIVLFGSYAKNKQVPGSDLDIIIIIDDATINFDNKLINWYREELGKIISANPYKKDLHINTIKLTTWWEDLTKGDPTIINILRYGEAMLDFGGFFDPLKVLLQDGRIRTTPESMYVVLNRVPEHIRRSKLAEISAIEGCYWAIVESSQALLMAIKILPPSPEHLPSLLQEHFVNKGMLKEKYVKIFRSLHDIHKQVIHGDVNDLEGKIIDDFQDNVEEFFQVVLKIIDDIIE